MLKWIIRNRLAAFEKKLDYDMSYAREILEIDTRAFFAFIKVQKIGEYRHGPKELYWAAKLTGTLSEDCGPCTQLLVSMAIADGLDAKLLAPIIANDEAAMTETVKLGVRFARAAIAHDIAADELRDEIVKRWGKKALVSVAFAMTCARIYPTLKYALGHGKTCQRVMIDGKPVAVVHAGERTARTA
jgi:hypothetical protein